MNDEMRAIGPDETFTFSCSIKVPCFNQCCRDLNQVLTPYDIVRLKNNLGVSSGDFLKKYTIQHTGPETGLPVVMLKFSDSRQFKCPFVTKIGCSVYEDRPGSCRTYPLARLASRSRETGKITAYYAVINEPHCRGFDEGKTQTVREWIKAQKIETYNEMNDLFMEIISIKNQLKPGPLDMKTSFIFQMACYDIDRFRTHIFEKGIPNGKEYIHILFNRLEDDDTELLKLAFIWIQTILFNGEC